MELFDVAIPATYRLQPMLNVPVRSEPVDIIGSDVTRTEYPVNVFLIRHANGRTRITSEGNLVR